MKEAKQGSRAGWGPLHSTAVARSTAFLYPEWHSTPVLVWLRGCPLTAGDWLHLDWKADATRHLSLFPLNFSLGAFFGV